MLKKVSTSHCHKGKGAQIRTTEATTEARAIEWDGGGTATKLTQSGERWAWTYSHSRLVSPVKAVLGMLVMALSYIRLQPGGGQWRCAGGGAGQCNTEISGRRKNKTRNQMMLERSATGFEYLDVGGLVRAY
jgi:hypothetical protein